MNLLENLNKEQLEAVRHKDGPLLIVAGAGTGKTTVITQRLAYLIEQGLARADEILALTFTEKAAGEMAERVDALLPYGYFDLWISTFHSFGERLLKEHGLSIGLPTDFKLLNELEQWALVKKNLHKFELDYYRPLGNPNKFIRALIKHFSRAKDEDIGPEQYLAYAEDEKQNFDQMLAGGNSRNSKPQARTIKQVPGANNQTDIKYKTQKTEIAEQEASRINEVANAYHVYQQLLLDNNALDFGDLINYSLKLFHERPAILEKYRSQFKYILLDEFQDTNWSQYELIKILAAPENNLVVVGDDDQSIFRFRGASMSNILQFVGDYPKTKKIILTKNYRSKQNILDLSYEFIKQNNPNRLEWQLENQKSSAVLGGRKERSQRDKEVLGKKRASDDEEKKNESKLNKKLIAENKGQGEVAVIRGTDLAEEVKLVVDKICELKLKDKTLSWNDFAILIRANDSASDFVLELERRGLPYIFGASRGLYLKPVVMDAISYFKLLDNYHESAAVWRILNLPIYKFTDAELINFNHLAGKKALSLYEVLNQAGVLQFSAELQGKIKPILSLVAKHSALAREKPASAVLLAFLNDSGYLKYLTGQTGLNDERAGSGYIDSSLPSDVKNDRKKVLTEQKSAEALGWLNQFLKRIQAFESASDDKSVKAFLAEFNLELEAGGEGSLEADLEAGPEAIKILTVHGAKGLEYKYVFIANLVDKRFPTVARSEQINLPDALIKEILPAGDVHLEEERRLFYVAMTRAKAGLYFSWAPDYGGKTKKRPSRFLIELKLVEGDDVKQKRLPEIKSSKIPNSEFRNSNEYLNSNLEIKNYKFNQNSKLNIFNLNNKNNFIIPAHFSYSQLAAYTNCPYQYRFAHILKIPVMGKEQFSFGKTMHATLQKLFALVNEKKGFGQADLFGGKIPPAASLTRGKNSHSQKGQAGGLITFEEILKLYDQSWIDDWYESKKKKQERKEQGREILKIFYEKHRDNWPKVLFLEKGFNLKITDSSSGPASAGAVYAIRGAIDRIDETASGLRLVDYKTGQAKEDLSFEEKEQLFIYQLAAGELFKRPVSGLAFYYLENNSQVEFIGDQKDLQKIKNKIISTIEEIKRGEFPPKPSRLCAWCDYRGICEYRE